MSGECKVDKVNPKFLNEAIEKARTLEQVFSSLHILQNGDQVLAPPNRIDPQDPDLAGRYRDIGADRWPYLADSRGGYSVAGLFSNGVNSDALNCALGVLKYSESQGKAVAGTIDKMRADNKTDSDVQGYLGGLSATDQRNYEIYNTIRFMHQFDKGDDSLDKDGDFSVISRADLTNWAEGLGDDGQVQGEKAVVRMHVILGLSNYFANPPAHALAPSTPGETGDSGVSDAAPLSPLVVASTSTTPNVLPPPAPATTAPTSTDGILSFGVKLALGAIGSVMLGSVGTYLLMKHRSASTAAAPEAAKNAAPRKEAKESVEPRAEKTSEKIVVKTEAKEVKAAKPASAKPAAEDDMSDVLDDLAKAKSNQSPAGGASLKNASLVTSDNVIIGGTKAEPIAGVDANVIRAQVVLHYRQFLSQSARDALLDGKSLPENSDIVNSSFKREVDEITDRIMAEYYQKNGTVEGRETVSDLWKSQLEDRGYIVRRGVPQRLLIEVATAYITEHSKSASSPFAGGVGAEMRTEAERHAGETKFVEEGLRDLMRHIGR